jgi:hypothetical protein
MMSPMMAPSMTLPINLAHSSAAKLFTDSIVAQRLADHEEASRIDSRCNAMKSS